MLFTCKMATSVGQKVSSPAALAVLNLSATSSGRLAGVAGIFGAAILSVVVWTCLCCAGKAWSKVSPS
jgi:hypothetical protein